MLDDPTLAATNGSGSIPQGEDGIVLRRGDSLDRFVIIDELGRGAMGTVYAAFDTKLERQVAVKLLHNADRGIGSLLAEAQALARINHPNVVTVHDVGEHQGRLFLAMELVRGKTLRDYQRAPGQLWRDILEHYRQAARGLAAVHAADLVHGDFKPENVMVAEDGRVLVMDFGIARSLRPTDSVDGEAPSSSGSRSVEVSRIRGTPAYMAPEQFRLEAVGPLSDQFAFCIALYEGLWGERPFEGTTLSELSRAVSANLRRPHPSKSSVPRWLGPIIDRGLSTDTEDRFESMLVLDDAFDASLRRRMKGFSLLGATGLTVVVAMTLALTPTRTDSCEEAANALQEQLSGPELSALHKRITDIEHPDARSVHA
ncbi:MAG: serine/threonine protein kinase, partial [Nannocystaceae bacterium]|nr:serine/threonine protein kinase [Nannocystaceae bacterium]